MLRRIITSIAALSALTATAACSGGSGPTTDPPPASTSSSDTAPPTTGAPPPSWESKYTTAQIQLYDEALQRWTDYERSAEPIWAKGRATAVARQLFKGYFLDWMAEFDRLKTYEEADVKVVGLPTIYWSKALRISKASSPGSHGISTEIQQCIDYASMRTTQHGKPPHGSHKKLGPVLREIRLIKVGNVQWLVAGVDDVLDGKARSCNPAT